MRARILIAANLLTIAACDGAAPDAVASNAAEANSADTSANVVATARPVDRAALAALLPPYPGAQQVRGGSEGGSLAFQTADPPRQVASFYADVARREGFTVDIPETDGMLVNMVATRDGGGLVNVTATRAGGITQVQIMAAAGAP